MYVYAFSFIWHIGKKARWEKDEPFGSSLSKGSPGDGFFPIHAIRRWADNEDGG
jgi:hypothetical protein